MIEEPPDLRQVYDRPWSGSATIWRPWWVRWLPVPDRFDFRTEVVVDDLGVDVHDTTTFADGTVWQRTMRGDPLGPGRWRMTADDMPGGADITVDSGGYTFDYRIWTPVLGPLRAPLRCHDEVRFTSDTTLEDTIELRFLGLHVGTVRMRLQKEPR